MADNDLSPGAPVPGPDRTVEDGFGGGWAMCGRPECGLQVVRPGKVQCWCDEPGARDQTDPTDEETAT